MLNMKIKVTDYPTVNWLSYLKCENQAYLYICIKYTVNKLLNGNKSYNILHVLLHIQ